MKEVEVKFKVSNLAAVRETLEAAGCVFSEPVQQEDRIFIPLGESVVPVRPGVNVLRIRSQAGKILLTLKRSDPENHLSKLEKEVEVSDAARMAEIITQLGFYEITQVRKHRSKCAHGGFEICLDEVEGLGSFVEVEKMTDGDPVQVQEEMRQLLHTVGIDTSHQAHVGYDILMVQKK